MIEFLHTRFNGTSQLLNIINLMTTGKFLINKQKNTNVHFETGTRPVSAPPGSQLPPGHTRVPHGRRGTTNSDFRRIFGHAGQRGRPGGPGGVPRDAHPGPSNGREAIVDRRHRHGAMQHLATTLFSPLTPHSRFINTKLKFYFSAEIASERPVSPLQ